MFIDYYQTLGLDKTATQDQIKTAYRKQARKFHPDLNPDDKEAHKKFQQINEANEVLSDPEKRKKYDQYGENWQHGEAYEQAQRQQQQQQRGRQQQQYGGGGNPFESYTYGGGGDFSDFFESMFGGTGRAGGRSQQNVKYRGQDLNASLQISLADAAKTHQQTLAVNGKNIRITIHAGIEDGQTIKIKGHGGAGVNGGPAGDLYIAFTIAEHPVFKRSGNDLYANIDLDLYKAVLGGEVFVETLDGKVKLTIKPETQNGSIVRLKGKGFPVYKKEGEHGDLFITFHVKVPTNLTEEQKELFRQLAATK